MFRTTFFLTVFLTLCLAACGPAPATQVSAAIVLTDGLGRQVTLKSPAQRIVSLAPSNTEILAAIGAGDQIVGRDELSDYPEELKTVDSVGGSMGDFSTEAIVALEPNLVLASELNAPELVKTLEALDLTIYYLPNPKSFDGLYENLATVGQLTGHGAEAKALIMSLQSRIAAVDKKIGSISARPLVFYELDGTDPLKPWTSGPGNFVDMLIDRAGGVNAGASLQDEWAQISSEELVAADPSIILLGDALYGVTVDSVAARPGWDGITAVKDNAIYPFNPNLATRPGPRLVDALEEMAKLLHPDLFK